MRTRSSNVSCVLVLMLAALLCACSSSPRSGGDGVAQASSSAPSAAQLAKLTDVDASSVASGPNVGQVIAIADIKKVLGRDDVVFAPAL